MREKYLFYSVAQTEQNMQFHVVNDISMANK